jgi:HK97 family phage prohead protease
MRREFRALPNGISGAEGSKVKGYFAKFNVLSQDLGGFHEMLAPGCFSQSLRENEDVLALVDHDTSKVLARTTSKTLNVNEDNVGLAFDLDLPDTSYARDLQVSLTRGDVSQCSFAFCVPSGGDDWTTLKDGTLLRTINEAILFEGSIVAMPAYLDTSASLRSMFPDGYSDEITQKLAESSAIKTSEKRYRGVLSAVAAQKWAILPAKLETICALINARAEGVEASDEEIRTVLAMQHGDAPETGDGVAVIPVYGVIAQRMSMFDDFSGGTSCEAVSKQLKAALADDTIGTIVLDVDSPGGTVTGVPELAAEIFAARSKKPIIAVANGMAASAAYWIASAATKFVVTPSGEVGSIGVYTTHQDVSAMMEKEGVKITFIQAGKYKTEGNPYAPLSAEAEADIQDGVDKFYNMFTQGVAGGRGVSWETVLSDFGQGRMLLAEDALKVGMVDAIASLDEVLAGLAVVTEEQVPGSEFAVPAESEYQASEDSFGEDDEACMCACSSCTAGDCDNCDNDECPDEDCTGTCHYNPYGEDSDGDDDEEDDGELDMLRMQQKRLSLKLKVNQVNQV